MSELVEKVARAIACVTPEQCDEEFRNTPSWAMWNEDARAAIAAVAEWIREEFRTDIDGEVYLVAVLLKQLEQPK